MCTDLSVGSWEGEVNEFKSAVCVNVGRMQEWGGGTHEGEQGGKDHVWLVLGEQ